MPSIGWLVSASTAHNPSKMRHLNSDGSLGMHDFGAGPDSKWKFIWKGDSDKFWLTTERLHQNKPLQMVSLDSNGALMTGPVWEDPQALWVPNWNGTVGSGLFWLVTDGDHRLPNKMVWGGTSGFGHSGFSADQTTLWMWHTLSSPAPSPPPAPPS